MTYTTEEKARLDRILGVFQSYVSEHRCFDILFSEKRGYLHILLEKHYIEATEITCSDHMFNLILNEIVNDVQDLFLCGEHVAADLFPEEAEEARRRTMRYIMQLPTAEQEHYIKEMDEALMHWDE